jgi:hypothetical protein
MYSSTVLHDTIDDRNEMKLNFVYIIKVRHQIVTQIVTSLI